MKTQDKIHAFFNWFTGGEAPENEYTPTIKVQSTYQPKEKASYNEVFEHVHNQLRIGENPELIK